MKFCRCLVFGLGILLLLQAQGYALHASALTEPAAQAAAAQFQPLFSLDSSMGTISAMAVDPAGNIYLTGNTTSASFPTTLGVVQPSIGGGTCVVINPGPGSGSVFTCQDTFVIKLDPTGRVIYSTFLGGSDADWGYSIVADAAGNAYVAGIANSKSFPTTAGAAFSSWNRPGGFIAKLNPQGTALTYSTLLPGLSGNWAAITIDSAGAVYFTGSVNRDGLPFPTTPGAFQTQSPGASGAPVVGKLNPAGSALVYSSYLGGTSVNTAQAYGIAIDSSANAYVVGFTGALDFPVTPGAFQTTLPNKNGAAFIAKLNATGSALAYGTYLGGNVIETGRVIRVDSQGNVQVLGDTTSTNFPVTAGAIQPTGPSALWSGNGAFLSNLNAQGTALVNSSYLAGAKVMDSDAAGNTYIAGYGGYGFPTTKGAYQGCVSAGEVNILVAEFDPSGKLLGATYVGGAASAVPTAIVARGDGNVYLAGEAGATQFVAKLLIDDPQKAASLCLTPFLQNAASFKAGPVAAGEMVTLRGSAFGPESAGAGFSSDLAGVRLFFDNLPAPLLYAESRQINAIVPWEMAGKTATNVHVEYNGLSTNIANVLVAQAAPGIFHTNFTSDQGAILNADMTPNSAVNRAARDSVVAIFGTGGGPTNPPGITGTFWPTDPLASLTLPVVVKIGGINAEVVYAGAAPGLVSGFFQINVRVPESLQPGSGYSVELSIGGIRDTSTTTIAVN